MNISSILITIVGIIVIIALYLVSRLSISKLPKNEPSKLPELKDEEGNRFSSVLDDIPATDGFKHGKTTQAKSSKQATAKTAKESKQKKTNSKQLILFISPESEQGLDGNLVKQALLDNGLKLGDNNIYHYFETDNAQNSLFRVANGVAPWTLNDSDLKDNYLKGLSLVLQISQNTDEAQAKKRFYTISNNIAQKSNGLLKDENQQPVDQKTLDSYISKS